jgi:hypothetical protein
MALPSSREMELETLLRQRDAQVLELTVRGTVPEAAHSLHRAHIYLSLLTCP